MKKKGQISATVNLVIFSAVAIFIGIWIIMIVQNSITLPTTMQINETINFVANDTYYSFANYPVISVTSVANISTTVDSGNYTFTSTQIKLVITNGYATGNYNVTYNYQQAQSNETFGQVATIGWSAIQLLAIGLILLAAGVIFAYFGFGKGRKR